MENHSLTPLGEQVAHEAERLVGELSALTIAAREQAAREFIIGTETGMAIAEVLEADTVVLTGGVRTPSDALVGPVAVAALRSLHLDSVFMGVHGMSARAGFTTPNLMEAETNRAFVDATEHLRHVLERLGRDVAAGLGGLPREPCARGSRGPGRVGIHGETSACALPVRIAWILEWIGDIVGLFCCLYFVWYGYLITKASYLAGSVNIKTLITPEWWTLAPLPVAPDDFRLAQGGPAVGAALSGGDAVRVPSCEGHSASDM